VEGIWQSLDTKKCGDGELLNTSTGECVHGLFFPDRRDSFGQWRLSNSQNPAQTGSTVSDLLRDGSVDFDERAADAFNSLYLAGALKLASAQLDGTNGKVATLNKTILESRGCLRPKNTFAAVVRVKNQAWALNEYMAHYALLGTSHIFLLDDSSEDNLMDVTKPWVEAGLLTVISKEGKISGEVDGETFQEARAKYDWVGFLDMDEYVMPYRHQCIPDILELYSKHGGVKLHWSLYEGHMSSDLQKSIHQRSLPETTLYEAIDYRLGAWQHLTKEIGQSRYVASLARSMPHCLRYEQGWFPVNENFQRADGKHLNGSEASPCWVGGPPGVGQVEPEQRLVTLLHVRALTLESWLERAVRTFNSVPHDRETTRKHFDLHEVVNSFRNSRVSSEPMPTEMSRIAHGLSMHMRWLVTV